MAEERLKLLAEVVDAEYLIESVGQEKEKKYSIKGNFIMTDRKNRNGRTYIKERIAPEVTRYINEMVIPKRAIGASQHPATAELTWNQAALLTESLEDCDGGYYGVAKILSTPDGQLLKALMNDGVKLSVSSRALGNCNAEGIVNDNFKLMAIDCVVLASSYISEVDSICEQFSFIINGDKYTQVAVENFQKDLSKNGTRNLENDLRKFITTLKNKI